MMTERDSYADLYQYPIIRISIVIGSVCVCIGMSLTTSFLAFNEQRIGFQLIDPILSALPPTDLSRPIFICTYSTIILGLLVSLRTPLYALRTIYAVCALLALRMIAMYLVPLEPPIGIIPLEDELLRHTTYSNQVLLKDLFFSGHTASAVLLSHLVDKRWISRLILVMSVIIATMLLIQRVHYTVDVLAAYVFAYFAYSIGVWMADQIVLINTKKEVTVLS